MSIKRLIPEADWYFHEDANRRLIALYHEDHASGHASSLMRPGLYYSSENQRFYRITTKDKQAKRTIYEMAVLDVIDVMDAAK